jgi:hypothetical protein
MLELLIYAPDSRIRPHITIEGSDVCEKDIEDRYGCVPTEREAVDSFCLDPGGFAFSDTDPITFEVKGVRASVRPEHLYAMEDISVRVFPNKDWIKVYLNGQCVVIPADVWAEVITIAKALAVAHPDGRDLLAERLADVPNVRIRK